MSRIVANLLWGLKYGALFALAFGIGIGLSVLIQGRAAFASYHPSSFEVLLGAAGLWIVGGLLVGLARPSGRSSVGYLIAATLGGVFVASAVLIVITGFSYFSIGMTLLFGFLLGQRVWIGRRNASQSAV
jgi:hypothetical protein